MLIYLEQRKNPIEIGLHRFKFEVTISHLDLEIEPSDIVTNIKATILAIEA